MFQECAELEFIDLSNINTENVNDMKTMFNSCYLNLLGRVPINLVLTADFSFLGI